jgi:hypothetical protein
MKYLMLLQWLGYSGGEAVRRAIEYNLSGCLRKDGSYGIVIKGEFALLPCHAAGMLRLMFWFGFGDDPRVKGILDWLLNLQEEDGGWPCVSKKGFYLCAYATADVLRLYCELPEPWLSARVRASRQKAVELFLNANLAEYGTGPPDPRWYTFGFPMFYDTDILEVLTLVSPDVSPDDERIQEALSFVLKKMDRRARWPIEKWPKGGMWINRYTTLEKIGQPSKWVTLHVLRMLKSYCGPEVVYEMPHHLRR